MTTFTQQMFRIHQWHLANIPAIQLYVDFKKVALDIYHQVDNEDEKTEPRTFIEKRRRMGRKQQ